MSLIVDKIDRQPAAEESFYQPFGSALELMYAKEPSVLIEGPSGTGKSRGALEKIHLCATKYPYFRGLIARKTKESLAQSVLVTYENKVLPKEHDIKFNWDAQEYRYPNRSIIAIGGMDKASRVMSSEYDIIYVPEATELAENDAEYLSTRLRNGIMPYQQLIMDCNPDAPYHWLNQRCIRGATRRIVSRHEDNPTVTAQYLATLDALTGYRYKRLRLGLWVSAEGQYFSEWDEDLHTISPFPIPANWSRWVGVDYGSARPFCALWFAKDPGNKHHIYIYREVYKEGLTDEQQAKIICSLSKGERISKYVADPSMFNSRKEQQRPSIAFVYARNGVLPIIPGMNDRISGWQTVRRTLSHDGNTKPRLQVFKGICANLIRTFPAMVHDPLDPEDMAQKTKGILSEDHALDALRYGLVFESIPERYPPRLRDFLVTTEA